MLIGLFPLVYSLVISFQNMTMTDQDTSFHGLMNYAQLFRDHRLWQAILHTLLITAVALPLELVLGLMMAQLFLDNMPGRQLFVALIVLPTIISPIVAGATWRLLFDHRYGPINQIISWLAGHQLVLLWTVNPRLVYPAIFICEIWQWTPFMFLILLAALSHVDRSLLEAAELDGARFWRIFFKIVLPAIWPVMAIAILIRGLDLFRIFDIDLGPDRRRPGHHDRDDLHLYLRPGISAVRDELHRRDRLPDRRSDVARRDLGPPAHGVRPMTRPPAGSRLPLRYAAAIALTLFFLFPIYWLFMISFKTPEEIFALPARLVSEEHSVRQLSRAVQGRRCLHRLEQPGAGEHQHLPRHGARHHLRLQPRPLQDRRRESRGVDHLATHDAADRHRLPDLPALCLARTGSIPISG